MKRFIREYDGYTDLGFGPGWLILTAICFLLFRPQTVAAQQDSVLSVWAEFVEEDADLAESIYYFLENPLNINQADKDELLELPFLTPGQADSILAFRRLQRRITRKYQLKKIVGSWTYRLIKDFITLKSPPPRRLRLIHRTVYPFDPAEAYINGSYEGTALTDYNKIYIELNQNLRAGLVTQKDAGESSFADYLNGFVCYEKNNRQLIAGKYYPSFGEGLVFGNPFSAMKSADALASFGGGLNRTTPSVSASENGGQFGLFGRSALFKRFSLSLFLDNNFRDARYGNDGRTIIGFDYGGYHRNNSEINAKNAIREQVIGITADHTFNTHFRMAVLISRFTYAPEIKYSAQTVADNEYRKNIFKFSGTTLVVRSLTYRFSWRKFLLKGEGAFSSPGGAALSQSLLWRGPKFGFGLHIWQAAKNYQSPYGRIFDDRQPFPQAQQGIYLGAALQPKNNIDINVYHIFKKDLWRGYFNKMPRWQKEWLLQSTIKTGLARIILRLRRKEAPAENSPELPPANRLNGQWIQRFQLNLPLRRNLRWRLRWQHTSLTALKENGSYLFQDLSYRFAKQWSASLRFTAYRSDSYQSRLYEYERDLPGSFANYALYGEGYKWYILLNYGLNRHLRCWLKYRYSRQYRKDLLSHSYNRQDELNRFLRFQFQLLF